MENINTVLAENIRKYRNIWELTQTELAEKLGVSSQAVSNWESAKSAPDIVFLPMMAEIFGCYIDNLFGKIVKTENHFDLCTELPFPDDTVMREVLCNGRKIIRVTPIG